MANKPKKLTASNILSLHSKMFTQKAIHIDVEGNMYEVLIDKKFQPTKIQELIMEMLEKQQQISKFEDIFNMTYYVNYLIIKYFTNISIANVNDFEKQIRVFKALLDLEIFEKVVESFDQSEIDKINKYIKKVSENAKNLENNPEAMEEINEIIQSISEIQNPEVFMDDADLEEEVVDKIESI